jgi:hypothetical protein
MEQHVKILAILNIVLGSLGVVGAVIVLLVFGGLSFAGFAANSGTSDGLATGGILGIIGVAVTVLILVLSLPSIIAGVGLLKYRPWARILTIVLSALHLLNIPLGTALGVYGFWVLLSPQTEYLFRNPGYAGMRQPPPYAPPRAPYVPPRQ